MWLIIRRSDSTVEGTAQQKPPDDAFDSEVFEVKEWIDGEPLIHDPEQGVESYDPTIDDPNYPDFVRRQLDYANLADKIANEIQWLEDHIPLVATADLDALRSYLRRLMIQLRAELKAWRYVIKKLV